MMNGAARGYNLREVQDCLGTSIILKPAVESESGGIIMFIIKLLNYC